MLIRSQDKFIIGLYNYQGNYSVGLYSIESDECISTIGSYDSVERAIKIIDKIQLAYMNCNFFTANPLNGVRTAVSIQNSVFEMPER